MAQTIPRTEINIDCPTERYQSQHRLTISISVQALVFNPLPKTGQLNGRIDKLNGSPTGNRPFRDLVFVIKISLWETALSIVANNPPKSTKQWCLWPLKVERWFFKCTFLYEYGGGSERYVGTGEAQKVGCGITRKGTTTLTTSKVHGEFMSPALFLFEVLKMGK